MSQIPFFCVEFSLWIVVKCPDFPNELIDNMKRILVALAMVFVSASMSAQVWKKEWHPADEMRGTKGYYYWWYWDNLNAFMYPEPGEYALLMCPDGIFDYFIFDGVKYIDIRIVFYDGTSLYYQTNTYAGVGDSGDVIVLFKDELRPVWTWLSKGQRYKIWHAGFRFYYKGQTR